MPEAKKYQINFSRGVNPSMPSHLIGDDEVQTATNIDFSIMNGALVPRQGSYKRASVSSYALATMFDNYNSQSSVITGNQYVCDSNGDVYRSGTSSYWAGSFTKINGSTAGRQSTAFPNAIGSYKNYAFFSGGSINLKDDGSATTDWVKQSPSAPTVTAGTLALTTWVPGTTWTAGAGTIQSVNTYDTTFATDDSFHVLATYTWGSDQNFNLNGTHTVGIYGVYTYWLAFGDPSSIDSVDIDLSIGDTSFTNYLHFGVTTGGNSGTPNSLLIAQLSTSSADVNSLLNPYVTQDALTVSNVAGSPSNWRIPITDFTFIGDTGSYTNPLEHVRAVRINVAGHAATTVTIGDFTIDGSVEYPMTDMNNGYVYWQTWATLDSNGNKIDESAPSGTTGPYKIQNGNFQVVTNGSPTGAHGITHTITYRQGGYMLDAYAVNTHTYTLTTFTDTMSDITALNNGDVLVRNIMTKSQFPGYVTTISEPWQDRLFFSDQNLVRWTLPGQIGAIPLTSYAEVSKPGDNIMGLVVSSPGMIIINRESIYEMYGTDFEGGNYTLNRIGSNRGSLATKATIKTPYGITLMNSDGLYIYTPGSAAPSPIDWFNQKYSDVFKGSFSYSPATYKGSRVPALNQSYIQESIAAFRQNKLYLGLPTGTSTVPNTIFVLDFTLKQAWWYTFPFNFTSMWVDGRDVGFYVGTTDGVVMQIEVSTVDQTTSGGNQAITWSAKSKTWTSDSDTILENLTVNAQGSPIVMKAYYDTTNTVTVGTLTNNNRSWIVSPLNGTFVNQIEFDFTGTCSITSPTGTGTLQSVYALGFHLMDEPMPVQYSRSDYDEQGWTADKLWDVAYSDIQVSGTGTVTAVTFVDTTAVMTNTMTGPTGGRKVFQFSFPAETYGRVAYTTYTSPVYFKPWETRYEARKEPAKVNYYKSDIESLDEVIIDAFDVDINPNGTVLATVYVDNTVLTTATITGYNRQSFTFDLNATSYPVNQFGRTMYVTYSGTAFKVYQTWWHKRPEPDRWNEYVSPKLTGDEREVKVFKPEVNCLSNTVLATTFLDGTAISTHTMTGTVRKQYTFSLPVEKYGRTLHAAYAVSGTGRFKHYTTDFDGAVEPPRVTLFRYGPMPYESSHWMKTWQPQLDCVNGTVTGTLIVDDQVMQTSTFTGTRKQWYTVGLDLNTNTNAYVLQTGSRWEAVYSGAAQFKHYNTKLESDTDPFRKTTWSFHYKKIGGASQLDLARYWSVFSKVPLGQDFAVATYWWDIDGENFNTGTLTLTEGLKWTDRIAFPPGARGRLFEFRMYAPQTIQVENVNLDLNQIGVKGLTRRGIPGTPLEGQ